MSSLTPGRFKLIRSIKDWIRTCVKLTHERILRVEIYQSKIHVGMIKCQAIELLWRTGLDGWLCCGMYSAPGKVGARTTMIRFSFSTALYNLHIRFHPLRQQDGDDYCRFKNRLFSIGQDVLTKRRRTKQNTARGEERSWIGMEAMNNVWEYDLYWMVSSTPMMTMILMMIRNFRICMLFSDTSYIVLLWSNLFLFSVNV